MISSVVRESELYWRVVSSILTLNSEFFLSFLVLEVSFSQIIIMMMMMMMMMMMIIINIKTELTLIVIDANYHT